MISVVIVTLNEESTIADCLRAIEPNPTVEVLVADGGSSDGTADLVRQFDHVRFMETTRGRGLQLNAGARACRGDIILFLHSDSLLPQGWREALLESLSDPNTVGGYFRLRTSCPDRGFFFNKLLRLADLRPNLLKQPYGDCGMYVRRTVFEKMGGYLDIPLMEDWDFGARLVRQGRVAQLAPEMITSGRRFDGHLIRSTVTMLAFPYLYRLGVPPATLDRLYGLVR